MVGRSPRETSTPRVILLSCVPTESKRKRERENHDVFPKLIASQISSAADANSNPASRKIFSLLAREFSVSSEQPATRLTSSLHTEIPLSTSCPIRLPLFTREFTVSSRLARLCPAASRTARSFHPGRPTERRLKEKKEEARLGWTIELFNRDT